MPQSRVLLRLPFFLVVGLFLTAAAISAAAQSYEPHTGQPAVVKQIASDLYFFYDYDGSNSVFLVTDAGLVVPNPRPLRKAQARLKRAQQALARK